jgi:hypothetical protein
MLNPENFPFCSEFYIVEKTIDVVISIAGRPTNVRIEALRGRSGEYSTRDYVETVIKLKSPSAAGSDEATIWVPYGLPWTHGHSADDVLSRALSFLSERCSKS